MMLLNIGAAVEPPVTYSEVVEMLAPQSKMEPTMGPSLVSTKPVKDVLNLLSE